MLSAQAEYAARHILPLPQQQIIRSGWAYKRNVLNKKYRDCYCLQLCMYVLHKVTMNRDITYFVFCPSENNAIPVSIKYTYFILAAFVVIYKRIHWCVKNEC